MILIRVGLIDNW